jgi:PAS domain S-box-containing protein
MWEKIVLNLLSNAFKFTFEGEISVSLRQAGEMVELAVRDTGTGIPAGEVPHLFERFHRVKGARGRSLEGSGIGLALVQELVKLHGGAVRLESEVDHGSTFTVTIPLGTAHLPADRIETARTLISTEMRGEVYVEEALRWLPEVQREELGIRHEAHLQTTGDKTPHPAHFASQTLPPRILFADDNADMREYVGRLLSGRYQVEAASDGLDALKAARERTPDLVLTDVMMPRLDGFGLLKELRADERLKTVPVILLSARAGEEASVEGIESGADDYLIKPFSARELVARVDANLKMARLRSEGERALRESEAKLAIELADSQQLQRVSSRLIRDDNVGLLYDDFLDAARALMRSDMASIQRLVPERHELFLLAQQGFAPESAKFWEWVETGDTTSCGVALARGEAVIVRDVEVWDLVKGTEDLLHYRLSGIRAMLSTPLVSRDGHLVGVISTHWREVHQPTERELRLLDVLARQAADLIERARAQEALSESEQRFRLLVDNVQGYALVQTDPEGKLTSWNPGAERLFGYNPAEILGHSFSRLLTIEDQQAGVLNQELACVLNGIGQRDERWLVRKDGSRFWAQSITEPVREEADRLRGVVKVIRDETERKRSEERQSLLMSELNHRVKNTLATVQAIASQTLRGAADPRQFVEKFKARLQALSSAHDVLTRRNWESADITDLVHDQLAMDGDVDRITVHGPAALLTPQSAVALSLVLHELGTNARKYGALAAPTGRLDVQWRVGAPEPMLYIEWAETGGPPVAEPQKRGFGTMLIEKSLGGVGGSAALRFDVGGLQCAIQVPLSPKNNGHTSRPEVV